MRRGPKTPAKSNQMFNRGTNLDTGAMGAAISPTALRALRAVSLALWISFVAVLAFTINKDGSPFR